MSRWRSARNSSETRNRSFPGPLNQGPSMLSKPPVCCKCRRLDPVSSGGGGGGDYRIWQAGETFREVWFSLWDIPLERKGFSTTCKNDEREREREREREMFIVNVTGP